MPKMKTKRGAAKRLKRTASGRLKRSRGWKRHKLEAKGPKRKRRLDRKSTRLNSSHLGISYAVFCLKKKKKKKKINETSKIKNRYSKNKLVQEKPTLIS